MNDQQDLTPDDQLLETKQRLMNLLESIDLEDEEGAGAPGHLKGAKCPNCESTESWGTSSWCPKCGFFPKTGKTVFGDHVRDALEQLDEKSFAHGNSKTENKRSQKLLIPLIVSSAVAGASFFLLPMLTDSGEDHQQIVDASTEEESSKEQTQVTSSGSDVTEESPDADFAPEIDPTRVVTTSEEIIAGKEFKSDYIVFGYSTNQEGEIRSVLLAAVHPRSQRPVYVGKFSLSTRDKDFLAEFQSILDRNRTSRSAIPVPYNARWSKPIVHCVIHHNGISPDGRFEEGQLVSFQLQMPTPEDENESSLDTAQGGPRLQAGKRSEAS